MKINNDIITMDYYVFANMSTENTLLKRDIYERDTKIYQLEKTLDDKNELIKALFETIRSLGGNQCLK